MVLHLSPILPWPGCASWYISISLLDWIRRHMVDYWKTYVTPLCVTSLNNPRIPAFWRQGVKNRQPPVGFCCLKREQQHHSIIYGGMLYVGSNPRRKKTPQNDQQPSEPKMVPFGLRPQFVATFQNNYYQNVLFLCRRLRALVFSIESTEADFKGDVFLVPILLTHGISYCLQVLVIVQK
jgi:hypothetical protein